MATILPALRRTLDMMPSPVPDRPGLLVRDPFRYSETILIVPPPLVHCLMFFDGRHDESELREALVCATGDVRAGEVIAPLRDAFSSSGFLEDTVHERMKDEKQREFARAPVREPSHSGSAYPADAEALRQTVAGYLDGTAPPEGDGVIGIAAPHVSPEGGWRSYAAAYASLAPRLLDRTFVILGTSHYGEPERFGLTRKSFATPYGHAAVALDLVDELARHAGSAAQMEDYCHAVEHSIEFQVVFLQHLFGPEVRILPILCGPFARATDRGGMPEDDPGIARVLEALRGIAAREKERLAWVLGVDLAHIGRRYGDKVGARAGQGPMLEVEERDRRRLDLVRAGDARGFWELLRENSDDLKWCGASPLYAFLKAVPGARGELLRYEQWNIDPHSVVSFAGLAFRES